MSLKMFSFLKILFFSFLFSSSDFHQSIFQFADPFFLSSNVLLIECIFYFNYCILQHNSLLILELTQLQGVSNSLFIFSLCSSIQFPSS